jgi:hypothetical protein
LLVVAPWRSRHLSGSELKILDDLAGQGALPVTDHALSEVVAGTDGSGVLESVFSRIIARVPSSN